ncbi:hypothetical protein NL676_025371 [Syzygium grande]|nr:hypothetical protein NL676_025371 [Syzygium grande]
MLISTWFENVTAHLEWMVAENRTCNEARSNLSSFACAGKNTECDDFGDEGVTTAVARMGTREIPMISPKGVQRPFIKRDEAVVHRGGVVTLTHLNINLDSGGDGDAMVTMTATFAAWLGRSGCGGYGGLSGR